MACATDFGFEKRRFCRTEVRPGLIIKAVNGQRVVLLVYLEEILMTASAQKLIDDTVALFAGLYTIRVLGEPTFFLGISFEWRTSDDGTLCVRLSQRHSIRQFLEDVGVGE